MLEQPGPSEEGVRKRYTPCREHQHERRGEQEGSAHRNSGDQISCPFVHDGDPLLRANLEGALARLQAERLGETVFQVVDGAAQEPEVLARQEGATQLVDVVAAARAPPLPRCSISEQVGRLIAPAADYLTSEAIDYSFRKTENQTARSRYAT